MMELSAAWGGTKKIAPPAPSPAPPSRERRGMRSHLPDRSGAEQPARSHDEHEDEQDVGGDLLDARVEEVPGEVFEDPQQHATDDRPRDAAEPAQDRAGEGLHADEAEVGVEIDDGRDQHAGHAADAGAD